MSTTKGNGTKYPLGKDAKYGYAYLSQGILSFPEPVQTGSSDSTAKACLPMTYAPYVRDFKTFTSKGKVRYELHIMCCAPTGHIMDLDNPVRFDYKGSSAFIFLNWAKQADNQTDDSDENSYQYFAVNCVFKTGISKKLANKEIFVIPVHDDPEEGEISKTKVEEEEEEIDV